MLGRDSAAPLNSVRGLLNADEMASAILLPARFAMLVAERLFLAEADSAQAIGGNTERNEILFDGASATVAEREVVLGGAALVAVTLDGDTHLRVVAQEVRGLSEGFAGIGANITFVEVKISIAHFLEEELVD